METEKFFSGDPSSFVNNSPDGSPENFRNWNIEKIKEKARRKGWDSETVEWILGKSLEVENGERICRIYIPKKGNFSLLHLINDFFKDDVVEPFGVEDTGGENVEYLYKWNNNCLHLCPRGRSEDLLYGAVSLLPDDIVLEFLNGSINKIKIAVPDFYEERKYKVLEVGWGRLGKFYGECREVKGEDNLQSLLGEESVLVQFFWKEAEG